MLRLTAEETARAVGGRVIFGDEKQVIAHISLDSRTAAKGDLFVPIIGERVDAHDFIGQVLKNGAAAVFTSRHQSREEAERAMAGQETGMSAKAEAAWIAVEDTRRALQALGSFLRSQNPIPLVGVTGSVGKTTTREMTAAALSAGFSVYKTPGNSNSQVGVPITLAEIPPEAQIGVIELGMSEPGEMTRIANIARVDCALITNIGVAHIEQLGSQENILREKLHIQDGMPADGPLLLNGDDPLLRTVHIPGRQIIFYGMGENCAYRGEELRVEGGQTAFTAVCGERRIPVRLQVMGSHMVQNALAALAAADYYGVDLEAAARELGGFTGYKGRQQILHIGGITVIDDSYNASPASMKAGIEVLHSLEGCRRKIAVLADMRELGPEAPAYHREVGAFAAGQNLDCLVLFGELAREIGTGVCGALEGVRMEQNAWQDTSAEGFAHPPQIQLCKSLDEVKAWLDENLKEGDGVLFKGSNSMGLSQAVKHLLDRQKQEKKENE